MLQQRLSEAAARLTPAERKVADALLDDPQAVAFGTVSQLANRAGTSGASVIRLSTKLGFDGFSELQALVRDEWSSRGSLRRRCEFADRRPTTRSPAGRDDALRCIEGSFASLARERAGTVIAALASTSSAVWVVAGEAGDGVARQFAGELSMLRPDVHRIDGTPVHVARCLAEVTDSDVVVALDLRRYDRWVVDVVRSAQACGATIIALTDTPLSPIADGADQMVVIEAGGSGPFDNYVGALAVLSAFTAGVARSLRTSAATRLARIEAAWANHEVLADDDVPTPRNP